MPELPEVETIRKDLSARLIGRRFESVDIIDPKLIKAPVPEEFQRQISGQTIGDIARRGKYFIFHLSEDRLVAHLKMTGALLHRPAGHEPDAYTRLIFNLDDASTLRFVDVRRFGALWLVADEEEVVGQLGPEAFGDGFTVALLKQRLDGRKAPIKPLLCDQSFLAGIGNIYSDEALHLAGIHPLRPAGSLSNDEIERLHDSIGTVFRNALANRGTSFNDYRDPDGRPGENQEALLVYRRQGEPCTRCSTQIERIKLRGKGVYFCPHCQPSHDEQ